MNLRERHYLAVDTKIGNAYLKWAVAEAACLLMRCLAKAKIFMQRMERRHGKSKAITLLSHRIGKAGLLAF